ncbi:hypothetical protein J6590_056852, partial [Homalodisca vitripennis]
STLRKHRLMSTRVTTYRTRFYVLCSHGVYETELTNRGSVYTKEINRLMSTRVTTYRTRLYVLCSHGVYETELTNRGSVYTKETPVNVYTSNNVQDTTLCTVFSWSIRN